MGNNNSRPPLADLDIYICGNVERYSGISIQFLLLNLDL